jgi:hyperosmotically inducible periplasmic protein
VKRTAAEPPPHHATFLIASGRESQNFKQEELIMRVHALLIALAIVAAGAQVQAGEHAAKKDSTAAESSRSDADDTGRNVRDRDGDTLTPGDQSESEPDLKLTQEIRKAVVADDTLSTTAQNIKIITQDGVVTLRGPVKSKEEKAKIEDKAKEIAGAGKVKSQLEVAAN